MQPIVIYHGQCRDGFCAAWCIWRRFPHAEFVEGFHGAPPPNVENRDVIMVDFAYPLATLRVMADKCKSMIILDHHKTTEADLIGLRRPSDLSLTIQFDMNRSGAGMAWDHYWPDSPRPWIVDYVEDRDLSRHKLPNNAAVNAYLSTLRFEFETWYQASRGSLERAAELGIIVEDKVRQYVLEVSKNAIRVLFEGYNIPMVNAPQVDVSELGSFLSQGEPLAMAWWQRGDGMYVYSLRSREPSNVDVSEIAKRYGGGGHTRAAGFQLVNKLMISRVYKAPGAHIKI